MLTWKDIINFTQNSNPTPNRRVEKTPEQWQEILTDHQFKITRQKGTEIANKGVHCTTYRPGRYQCDCCGNPLFESIIICESGKGVSNYMLLGAVNAKEYD